MRIISALILTLVLAPPVPVQAAKPPTREITETKERLTAEDMESLVAKPLALARAGDMAGADAALEKLLAERARRYGPDSIEVSDTLASFMVLLFIDDLKADALAYGPRALDATRRAWGSDHLEYALMLNDLVQMDYKTNGDDVGPQSEAALMEVYRIRVSRLGPQHKETLSTLVYLGNIQGQRSRTDGEIAKATPAIATLNRAIAGLERDRPPGLNDNLWARATLAETYARNGALDLALATYQGVVDMAAAQNAVDTLMPTLFANALRESGYNKEADAIVEAWFGSAAPSAAAAAHGEAKASAVAVP